MNVNLTMKKNIIFPVTFLATKKEYTASLENFRKYYRHYNFYAHKLSDFSRRKEQVKNWD